MAPHSPAAETLWVPKSWSKSRDQAIFVDLVTDASVSCRGTAQDRPVRAAASAARRRAERPGRKTWLLVLARPGYAQATGRFRGWWQVLGSNQRRRSRWFTDRSLRPSHPPLPARTRFEARLRVAAVRYASVSAGFRSRAGHGRRRTGPRTGTEGPRTGAEKATDEAGGSVTPTVRRLGAFTWHFRIPAHYHRLPPVAVFASPQPPGQRV
jgi:hypothetical protein